MLHYFISIYRVDAYCRWVHHATLSRPVVCSGFRAEAAARGYNPRLNQARLAFVDRMLLVIWIRLVRVSGWHLTVGASLRSRLPYVLIGLAITNDSKGHRRRRFENCKTRACLVRIVRNIRALHQSLYPALSARALTQVPARTPLFDGS